MKWVHPGVSLGSQCRGHPNWVSEAEVGVKLVSQGALCRGCLRGAAGAAVVHGLGRSQGALCSGHPGRTAVAEVGTGLGILGLSMQRVPSATLLKHP